MKNCRCGKWLAEGGASVDEWRSFGMLARYAGITRQTGWLEVHSFPIDQYTKHPQVVDNYRAVAPDTYGIGVEFDWDKLSIYEA
ncbi:TPA: hypothetical protein ACGTKP_002744 [Salmonella enterica]